MVTGGRGELLGGVAVIVDSSCRVKELGQDPPPTAVVLGGAEHGEEQLVGSDTGRAVRLRCRASASSKLQHGADQVDP